MALLSEAAQIAKSGPKSAAFRFDLKMNTFGHQVGLNQIKVNQITFILMHTSYCINEAQEC